MFLCTLSGDRYFVDAKVTPLFHAREFYGFTVIAIVVNYWIYFCVWKESRNRMVSNGIWFVFGCSEDMRSA